MALTTSTMPKLKTSAAPFSLPDVVSGQTISLATFQGKKALLVMFICQHCPYVQHVKYELAKLGHDYTHEDLGIVAISSNDATSYPDDSPAGLKKMAEELELNYPLLYDETQAIARAYQAACTPDFFLYNSNFELVYRGQLDDSRPGNDKLVTGKDLRTAIDAILNDQPLPTKQIPSSGCNIKWKSP